MGDKYTAVDVANYIIWYAKEKCDNTPITHLKLQKILYYVAAYYLQNTKKLLFSEPFKKWQYGPVAKSVYDEFKYFKYDNISMYASILVADENKKIGYAIKPFEEKIFLEDKTFCRIADKVIKDLIKKNAFDLVEITHKEEAWKKYQQDIIYRKENLEYTIDELKCANYE